MIPTFTLQQRYVVGLCAGLSVLLFVSFIYVCWQWQKDWALAHTAITETAMVKTDESESLIAALPSEHLFGKAFSSEGNVPITSLQLRVAGIVKINSEGSASVSKAYISMAGQPSKIYQTGDNLPYGVKVYDIQPDAVILENDGHLEKLPLPREKLEFKPRKKEEEL